MALTEMNDLDGAAMSHLILTGGRITDPANGRDEIADIAFKDGKVAEIGRNLSHVGAETVDVTGKIVTPGLIDLHTHVYWGAPRSGLTPRRSPRPAAPPPLSTPAVRDPAIFMASAVM